MWHDDPLPVRLYRRALVMLPRAFRRRHAAAMVAMLAEEWHDRRGLSRAALLLRAVVDLMWTAVIERIGASDGRHEKGAGMRSSRAVGISWLDFKLGFRMLVKYPGVTIVGGLSIAFAIWVGAGAFELVTQAVYPRLPLPDGDRIVGIRLWHTASSRVETQASHDFNAWREELESVEDLGAFRTFERNLTTEEGEGEPIEVAEISASAFRVARVPPLLGRSLVEADEQVGAPPVVVIGYDVWQARFTGAADVVGREVRLGSTAHTVVGVMPEDFAFPVAHSLWAPLRLNVLDHEPGEGPAIRVFGRLAPGVPLDEAQAELTLLGLRAAAAFPDTHEHLRPQVLPYARSFRSGVGSNSAWLMTGNVPLVLLLVFLCANVALLMFARAATREREIVVRNALGANRGRIIAQLFAEALVLAGLAAAIGLAGANFGLRWALAMLEGELLDGAKFPFWFRDSLSPVTVLYAAALAVLAAAIAGVVPAMKATRGLGSRLRQATAGGGGLRFAGVWTAVIVAQVTITVTLPAVAFFTWRPAAQIRSYDLGFPPEAYLSARLEMDRESSPDVSGDTSRAAFLARFDETYHELERRIEADPAVIGVTFAGVLPRMYHGWNRIEVDGGAAAPRASAHDQRVSAATVAADYFETLDAQILAGRGFHSGDLADDAGAVIVNQPFVDRILGGRNPIGRRVRYVAGESERAHAKSRPWYEIVGVVRDLGMVDASLAPGRPGLYHPIVRGNAHRVYTAVHVRGNAESFEPQLRTAADAVDPTLRLHDLMPLDEVINADLQFLGFWSWLTALVSAIALLLSLAGIYSVMSFTVSQRTREIGIRIALGADARHIALTIFRRPLVRVGVGILAGIGLVAALVPAATPDGLTATSVALVAAYAALMIGVCLLACVVPTRRALGVEPAEALSAKQ